MTDPSLALQEALGTLLAVSAPLTALVPADMILDSSSMPISSTSIIIGEGQTMHPELTVDRDTRRVYLDLHVWTVGDDLACSKVITGAIRDVLRNVVPLAIEDHRLVDLVIQTTRYMRDKEGETPLAHAVMTVNALLQEAAS